MSSNVGLVDRFVRLILAAAFFYAGLITYAGSSTGVVLDIAGSVLTLTALFGFCGLYKVLGISTSQSSQNSQF